MNPGRRGEPQGGDVSADSRGGWCEEAEACWTKAASTEASPIDLKAERLVLFRGRTKRCDA